MYNKIKTFSKKIPELTHSLKICFDHISVDY